MSPQKQVSTSKHIGKRILNTVGMTLSLLVLSGLLGFLAIFYVPEIYYAYTPVETVVQKTKQTTSPMAQALGITIPDQDADATLSSGEATELQQHKKPASRTIALPPQNPTLPEGDWLIIPRIGVRTELQDTQNPDEALDTGVWMSPEYGKPGDISYPMIIAGHRFGWQWWWKNDYWKYNSFYLLPDLEPGDVVEIISDQRKWTYEIYAGEHGEEITDYNADLILYTCKYLSSPVRYFRYAKLIDTSVNTQAML